MKDKILSSCIQHFLSAGYESVRHCTEGIFTEQKEKMKDEKVRSMMSNIRLEKRSRENSVLSY